MPKISARGELCVTSEQDGGTKCCCKGERYFIWLPGGPETFVSREGEVSVCNTGWTLSCARIKGPHRTDWMGPVGISIGYKSGKRAYKNTEILMASSSTPPLRDVAILTRAIENVFRKLIRMLIGRMSLKKLQEMIQVIFIEEAEQMLRRETPGKNVALTTLAVITGFDTRTITKIKRNDSYLKSFHQEERFLSQITPECSVLDVWESSPTYTDLEFGKPRILDIRGATASFESLISESVATRGVTVNSFLQRLEASHSVVVDRRRNKVRMIDKRYTPFESKDITENARIGMAVVGNLVDTIAHNLNASEQSGEPFYQQGCWTNRLKKKDSKKLREMVRVFLLESDERARKIIAPFEQNEADTDQVTAGISMFYFEEEART